MQALERGRDKGNLVGDVNKPTTRNTRHANDNVHAKGLAVEKPLLAGYARREGKKERKRLQLAHCLFRLSHSPANEKSSLVRF